jgi:hypothetical protein
MMGVIAAEATAAAKQITPTQNAVCHPELMKKV